jgi:hypothetical protein
MPPASRHASWSLIQVCVMHDGLSGAVSGDVVLLEIAAV